MLYRFDLEPGETARPETLAQLHIQNLRADQRDRQRRKWRRARSRRRGQHPNQRRR